MNDMREKEIDVSQGFELLSEAWKDAENYFRTFHVPVQVSYGGNIVKIKDESFPDPDHLPHLSWRKVNGIWCICYGIYGNKEKPILECSTEVRITMVVNLAGLKRKLERMRDGLLPRLLKAAKDIHKIIEK